MKANCHSDFNSDSNFDRIVSHYITLHGTDCVYCKRARDLLAKSIQPSGHSQSDLLFFCRSAQFLTD